MVVFHLKQLYQHTTILMDGFKNNGIDATFIGAFDDADYDKNTIIIGLQDNGANVYFDNPGVYDWYRVSGSDGHNAKNK